MPSSPGRPGYVHLDSDNGFVPLASPPHESDLTPQPEPAQAEEPKLSPDDLLALAVNFAIEYALPWKAAEALQKLLAYVLRRSDLPLTKFLFIKNAGISIDAAKFHFYCDNCKSLVSETSGLLAERNGVRGCCNVCTKVYSGREMMQDGHFYVSLPLRQQLESLLSSQELAVPLRERLDRLEDCRQDDNSGFQDITDGKGYHAMREKIKKYDLSLTVTSDGSPLFKSSKFSIWPVQVTINELPLHHRSKHVTTTLWYGQSHPQMELLMESFVRELEHLAQRGITWTDGTSSITSQRRLLERSWLLGFEPYGDAPLRLRDQPSSDDESGGDDGENSACARKAPVVSRARGKTTVCGNPDDEPLIPIVSGIRTGDTTTSATASLHTGFGDAWAGEKHTDFGAKPINTLWKASNLKLSIAITDGCTPMEVIAGRLDPQFQHTAASSLRMGSQLLFDA
ncbi:hypothetical protein HPB50_001114 [Hyalomma asiaticum]|uniref:Uncharacterized protein n=1 Tax=Hyalomma asiaticum TaxID=266040 RepID=A0ACB7RX88_HYAAI|nr:hypothetical protein HPB50_001114 [Hyalomma asiaticum]